MRILLDTHAVLWWLIKSPRLPISVRDLLTGQDHTVFVSAASVWEIATKARLGKLDIEMEVVENLLFYLERERFRIIPMSAEHSLRAGLLPGPHRDPFDRMLLAQALTENIPIVSNDRALDGYGVTRLW